MTHYLKSMTGFGRAECNQGALHVLVEIKSLNGKQHDLNLKLPPLLKPYEFAMRNMVSAGLVRGSIDCTITLKQHGASKPVVINTDLLKAYYLSVKELSDELGLDSSQAMGSLLRLPEVAIPVTEVVDEAGWLLVKQTLEEAIANLNEHRHKEGKVLHTDLAQRIGAILGYQSMIAEQAPLRNVRIRENIQKKLEELVSPELIDRNRLEQELVYYIEKIDISEELVRLKNHCDYFFSILESEDPSRGKKLGFVLQEIGREINTAGAKAYDADMQKLVVLMKDELERAKEQILNVL
jgi:uncharacterized protein (TIGR00255 family)